MIKHQMTNDTPPADSNPDLIPASQADRPAIPHWEISDDHDRQKSIAVGPPQWTRYIDSRLKQFCTR